MIPLPLDHQEEDSTTNSAFQLLFVPKKCNFTNQVISQVLELSLKTDDLTILNGSNYIELPKTLSSIINEQNEDNECFKYAVLSTIHYDDIYKNHQRVSKYKNYQDELNFKGIKFPVSLKDIDKFEK